VLVTPQKNKISCYNNCPNLGEMYKLFSTFVGCFQTASKSRPSIGLCADLAVGLYSLYFVVLQATSPKYFLSIKKLFQHKRKMKTFADKVNFF